MATADPLSPQNAAPSGRALLERALKAYPAEAAQIAPRFEAAAARLRDEIVFTDFGGDMHAKAHAERVLLFALLLGAMALRGRPDQSDCLECLAWAAIFHDARRENDDLDTGHGLRAADYCRAFFAERGQPAPEAACVVMAFHDLDDLIGRGAFLARDLPDWGVLAYELFKDADALDRFRFGPDALDHSFLRTASARALVPFAASLFA